MIKLSGKNFQKKTQKIKKLSKLVESRILKIEQNDEQKIEKLSFEELQDFNQILCLADYVLCKYEAKKSTQKILKEFVEMIENSVNSMDLLDDNIAELEITAEISLEKIKQMHIKVSENFTMDSIFTSSQKLSKSEPENSTNNLTKSTTPVYPRAYLCKSTLDFER